MTLYLVDTNIVSALAPRKLESFSLRSETADWLLRNQASLYISAISVVEIEAGVLKLERVQPGRWQRDLSNWYNGLLTQLADRILPVDVDIARIAAGLTDRCFARGMHPGLPDMAIAATAIAHNMVLLTRNMRHFAPLGIAVADPFDVAPDERT